MKNLLKFIKKVFIKVESVFYVGATDILKEPLTREQEEYYIKKKEEGDLKAKEKLIEHNLRLVVFLAKKYENTGVDLEDLVSIGNIGLIKGINTFSSDKNIKLVKGSTNSTRNILFYEYGQGHLDYNLWIEVEEGNKTWVYDLFSLLKMEKDFYYELEEPKIEKIYLKDVLDLNKDFSSFSNQYDNILYEMIDKLKESLEDSPYKELLIPEIIRYEDNISKEKVKSKKFW